MKRGCDMPKKKKPAAPRCGAVIYVRVSSEEQVENTSLATQESQCKAYCEARNIPIIGVYRDEGISAKSLSKRHGLASALAAVTTANAAQLVVYRMDRLSRNTADFHAVAARLDGAGCQLISVTEPSSDDAAGRMMRSIIASVAEFDNSVRGARAAAGMAARKAQGGWVASAPMGYRHARTPAGIPTLAVDESTAPLVRKAFAMAAGGSSLSDIRKALGGGYPNRTIANILRNRAYLAESPALWAPLVDGELFHRAGVMLSMNDKRPPQSRTRERSAPTWRYSGLILCMECGRHLSASRSAGGTIRYFCAGSHGGGTVRESVIDAVITDIMGSVDISESQCLLILERMNESEREENSRVDEEMAKDKARESELRERRKRAVELALSGAIGSDELRDIIGPIDVELGAMQQSHGVEALMARAKRRGELRAQFDAAMRTIARLMVSPSRAWSIADDTAKRALFRLCLVSDTAWSKDSGLQARKADVFQRLADMASMGSSEAHLTADSLQAITDTMAELAKIIGSVASDKSEVEQPNFR